MKKKNVFLRIKEDNQGDALIVVLCVLVVLIALSVSLLLSVSTLNGSTRKVAISERCRIMAVSFSDKIADELTSIEAASSDSFPKYIKNEIKNEDDSWEYYDPPTDDLPTDDSIAAVSKTFDVSSSKQQLGAQLDNYDISAEMYIMAGVEEDSDEEDNLDEEDNPDEGDSPDEGEDLDEGEDPDEGEDLSEVDQEYDGIRLVVIITAKKNREIFKVQTSYILTVDEGEWIWKGERRW